MSLVTGRLEMGERGMDGEGQEKREKNGWKEEGEDMAGKEERRGWGEEG